ncbi:hypothetical protein MMC30_004007 [Trapelia coarctata]|nr:hypothetical protein [Trapelia coarctata]
METFRHVKGQLSKAKKATANAVRRTSIPSGTAKLLRNTRLFCTSSPRDSLLSLGSETIHVSSASELCASSASKFHASSASDLSTHTGIPRDFSALEKPRRLSESPHSLRELLHSPDSHYARNPNGAARVLRVSNPDLHDAYLDDSSYHPTPSFSSGANIVLAGGHTMATDGQTIPNHETTPEQSSWYSGDDDSDTEDSPSQLPLHSPTPPKPSFIATNPAQAKQTAHAASELSWTNSLQRASSLAKIVAELDDKSPPPVPPKDPRRGICLADFDLNPSLQGPGSRFPPFTREAAVIAPAQKPRAETKERGRSLTREPSLPLHDSPLPPLPNRAAHIIQAHAQRTAAIADNIKARKLAVDHPDPLRSSPSAESFRQPVAVGENRRSDGDGARSSPIPPSPLHPGFMRNGRDEARLKLRFQPTLSPKREVDGELHLGEEGVEREEVPRRHPTTLLSGPALGARKGGMDGKLGEEDAPERSVSPVHEFPGLHELPTLQEFPSLQELPPSQSVSPLQDNPQAPPPSHPETPNLSPLQPCSAPAAGEAHVLVELPGDFTYPSKQQTKLSEESCLVELPGDFSYPAEHQTETAEVGTADEVIGEWRGWMQEWDLGRSFAEGWEGLLPEEESGGEMEGFGEKGKRVGNGEGKFVKVWVSLRRE